MSVSAHIHRRLVDLWKRAELSSGTTVKALCARWPCSSRLRTVSSWTLPSQRSSRGARRIVSSGSPDPDPAYAENQNLLIYCPRRRGRTDEERCEDPFEVFAVFGAVFGDKESESLPSLARQAMPERAADIDRLFAEGHPTLSMLDNLQAGSHFPAARLALMRSTCGSGAMRVQVQWQRLPQCLG